MSMFATNALLGGGVIGLIRVWIREQRNMATANLDITRTGGFIFWIMCHTDETKYG